MKKKRVRTLEHKIWMRKYLCEYRKAQKAKINIIKDEFGGECELCGYNKNYAALSFHHLDPETKLFTISDAIRGTSGTRSQSWDDIRKEADKCILLCFNCHADIHSPEWRK